MVKKAIGDSSTKLFRYFRRDQQTYCFLEVELDWTITESVIRRLATHKIDVQIFESPDKLSQRAKTDFRAPKKMSLPLFAIPSFSAKQSKDFADSSADGKDPNDAKRTEWIATWLIEACRQIYAFYKTH